MISLCWRSTFFQFFFLYFSFSFVSFKTNIDWYCAVHTCVPFSTNPISMNHTNIVYCLLLQHHTIDTYRHYTESGWVCCVWICAVIAFVVHFSSGWPMVKGPKMKFITNHLFVTIRIRFRVKSIDLRVCSNSTHIHKNTFSHSTDEHFSKCCLLMMMKCSVFDRLIFNNILNFIWYFSQRTWTH